MHQINQNIALALIDECHAGKMQPIEAARASEVIAAANAVGKNTIVNIILYSTIGIGCSVAIASPAGLLVGAGGYVATLFQKGARARRRGQEIMKMSPAELQAALADNDLAVLRQLIESQPDLAKSQAETPTAAELAENPSAIANAKSRTAKAAETETASQPEGRRPIAIDSIGHVFASEPRCTVLCAPARCGKGMALVEIQHHFKQAYPDSWLGTCTIKQFAGENWYWLWSDRHVNPNTERNADHTPADHVAAAKLIYSIYMEWYTMPASADKPALLIVDELRDTLKRLEDVQAQEVDPALPDRTFCDWMRSDMISAATLNQCNYRYLLLAAPVNTAGALGFKKAADLGSFKAFTLASKTDRQFCPSAGSAIFRSPEVPDGDWGDWYSVAYHTGSDAWYGVGRCDQADIDFLAAEHAGTVHEGSMLWQQNQLNNLLNKPDQQPSNLHSDGQQPTSPAEPQVDLLAVCIDKIRSSKKPYITLAALKTKLSNTQRQSWNDEFQAQLLGDDRLNVKEVDISGNRKSIRLSYADKPAVSE